MEVMTSLSDEESFSKKAPMYGCPCASSSRMARMTGGEVMVTAL